MTGVELHSGHLAIGASLLEAMQRRRIRPLDAQLGLVAALSLLADTAGDRTKCVENTLAMLAQLNDVDATAPLIAAVRAALEAMPETEVLS